MRMENSLKKIVIWKACLQEFVYVSQISPDEFLSALYLAIFLWGYYTTMDCELYNNFLFSLYLF